MYKYHKIVSFPIKNKKGREDGAELYVLSDEDIKKGELCYDELLNVVFWSLKDVFWDEKTKACKIIATTDTSLNLPLIPKNWVCVQLIFKALNYTVKVEYEEFCCDARIIGGLEGPDCCHNNSIRLKLNKKSEINILEIKQNLTFEQVEKLCRKAFQAGGKYYSDLRYIANHPSEDTWIENNLS